MKTPHQIRVEEMMSRMGQESPPAPAMPDAPTRRLRCVLIMEEALETCRALGFDILDGWERPLLERIKDDSFEYAAVEPDLAEIVDGCADLSVVSVGTLSACGVADGPVLEEVDRNNLAKFGPGGYADERGKWMKPPDHKPPDIERVLKEQGYDPSVQA